MVVSPVPVPQQTLSPPAVPPAQEALIHQIRLEVRTNPTDETNVRPRHQVLQTWIRLLLNRGYPVNRVLPPEKVQVIGKEISSGNLRQAGLLIDEAYQILEKLVAGK